MKSLGAGARIAAGRLSGRFSFVTLGLSAAFVVTAGVMERNTSTSPVDNVLLGAAFGVSIPLVGYAIASRACGLGRVQDAVELMARHGIDRRGGVLGLLVTGGIAATVVALVLATLGIAAAARWRPDGGDLATTVWIGGLGGLAYFSLFALGGCFGKRGGGRWLLLAGDWVLGTSTTFIALPWPRAHLRNLLGAEAPLGMAQWQASMCLLFITLVGVSLALLRTPR